MICLRYGRIKPFSEAITMSPIAIIACSFTSISTEPAYRIALKRGIKVSDFYSTLSKMLLAMSDTMPHADRIEYSSVRSKSNDIALNKLSIIWSK